VREAAANCGVDPSTSFRWRHRFLAVLQDQAPVTLTGIVEAAEVRFTRADKGVRDLGRPARRRGGHQHRGFRHPEERVLLLLDRGGAATELLLSAVTNGGPQPRPGEWVAGDALLCGANDAGLARCLKQAGLEQRLVVAAQTGTVFHNGHVEIHAAELRAWLQRFHGVSSRYLGNYLVWWRLLLRDNRPISSADFIARMFC